MRSLDFVKLIAGLVVVSTLISGCSAQLTTTPIPPTTTPTSLPPTATPTSTNTPVPPTATSTPVPPTATVTLTPTPDRVTELYDFENQQAALPNGFSESLGASINPAGAWSKYEIDNSVAHSGAKSLKISSDINTGRWYFLGRQIPTNFRKIIVTYYAKGNNIHKEGKQFENCYLGFMITDPGGKKQFNANQYQGTFDWVYGELQLAEPELKSIRDSGSKVEFGIFVSMSGEFWIDDLKFELFPLAP